MSVKVLMISGDKRVLEEGSDAYRRLELQRSVVERLDVFVWPQVDSAWSIVRAAQGGHYDVVTSQDPFWRGLLGLVVARVSGAKLNLQVHADLQGQSWWRAALAHFLLRRADTVRVVSERVQKTLPHNIRAQVSVLPIFVDIEPFTKITHTPHSQFKKTILWVGRFEPEKDPLRALTVLERVRTAGVDARLIMLGAGSLEATLRARTHKSDLCVEFPGWQDSKEYLGFADVVLSTSKHESYGASIIEALAAGVPVVSLDVGVAREAGATVVAPEQVVQATVEILQKGLRGHLQLSLPNEGEWAQEWQKTL